MFSPKVMTSYVKAKRLVQLSTDYYIYNLPKNSQTVTSAKDGRRLYYFVLLETSTTFKNSSNNLKFLAAVGLMLFII